MQNNDKLCPFCGSEPVENKEHYIPNNLCCPHGHTTPMIRNEWNTRPAEKLVPLDKVKIYHLIKKYFLTIPGDDRPTNILQDTALDDACDEICARFASVPVVPDMVWPDTIKPSLSGDGSYVNGYMDAIEACKAAHAKAFANHFTAPAVIEWPPDRDIYPPDHEGPFDNHDYAMGWNDRGEADKAAHAKALAVDKSYMGDGKTTSQEAKERKG